MRAIKKLWLNIRIEILLSIVLKVRFTIAERLWVVVMNALMFNRYYRVGDNVVTMLLEHKQRFANKSGRLLHHALELCDEERNL